MKYFQKDLFFLFIIFISNTVFGQFDDDYTDKVQSPYFEAKTTEDAIVHFPLVSTSVDVAIAGNIADVTIVQTYKNSSNFNLEANYVFPGSTKSAVYGLQMTINKRVIKAEIKEKKEAKEIYEKAKEEGKTTSLLEQHRPNVFEMHVGNILPNDVILVELKYTETIVPVEGQYEYVYPTAIGERYKNHKDSNKDTWTDNPYAHAGSKSVKTPEQQFSIAVNINSPTTISKINCPSHQCKINFKSDKSASLDLVNNKSFEKDFILKYELTESEISSGLLIYEDAEEKFFMYTAQPPKRIIKNQIPAREYIFILDVSGSMNGFPMEVSKNMIEKLLKGLNAKDKFNLILFASGRQVAFDAPVAVTNSNIETALDLIDKQNGSGGTELLPALEEALSMSSDNDISKSVVILTDGLVSVEKEAFDIIQEKCNEANFFAFGIGTSINRYLLEGLAHIGRTDPIVVTSHEDAARQSTLFRKMISSPVLTNVKIDLGDFDAYDIEPSSYADMFLEKPIVVYGKYKGTPKGEITLSGTSGNGNFSNTLKVSDYKKEKKNSAIKQLWARKKIQVLSDYNTITNDDLQTEITQLGLKYSLLTEFTSFVAVDTEVRNKENTSSKMSESHNNSGGVPEPHEWALIIVCAMFMGYQLLKWKKANAFKFIS